MPQSWSAYPTNLSDAEWRILEPLLPTEKPGGRHRKYPLRQIIDAIQYILRGGCAWRLMPCDLPHWRTVYEYFRHWKRDGTWRRIHDHLRAEVRTRMQRNVQPSAAVIDSQSVKTTEKGGPWLRRSKEDRRQKTSHSRGYNGSFAARHRSCCRRQRSGFSTALVQ